MSDDEEPQYRLNDIGNDDFRAWRRHPVTKLFLRYLIDYREMLRAQQVAEIEGSDSELPPKKQGEFAGRVRTLTELATIEFGHLVDFYPIEDNEDETHAA